MQHLTSHSKQGDDLVRLQLAFFQFTTGISHPLSSTHTVQLPSIAAVDFSDVGTEMLGDYILTSIRCRTGLASFYLVSWKSGTVTLVSGAVNLVFFPAEAVSEASRSIGNVDTALGWSTEAYGYRQQPDCTDKR